MKARKKNKLKRALKKALKNARKRRSYTKKELPRRRYGIPLLLHSGINPEPFSDYYSRWPYRLNNFPKEVIEEWIYRHYPNFLEWYQMYEISEWTFERKTLTSQETECIEHLEGELDHWLELGEDWLNPYGQHQHYEVWLRTFMLENGTFPTPIIISEDAGGKLHPKSRSYGDDYMQEPLQLIEGHKRLGFIRALIKSNNMNLKNKHAVWALFFN